MKWLTAMFKQTKWVVWAVIATAAVVALWLLRTLFTADPEAPARLPEVPPKLKAKVAKAEEDALVARVEARVEAEKAKAILDEAASADDDKERRKRLAEALRRL